MRHAPLDGLSRITVMLGESGRWRGVLSKARTFADRAGVPLRLVTVATGDSQDTAEIEKRTEALLAEVRLDLTGLDDQRVQIVHAHSMSAAVLAMEWSRNELAFLGSARWPRAGACSWGRTPTRSCGSCRCRSSPSRLIRPTSEVEHERRDHQLWRRAVEEGIG